MIQAALQAFRDIWTRPFRSVFWKSFGLAVLLLILLWVGVNGVLSAFLVLPYPWLETILAIVAGFGTVVALIFLVAPVSSLVAGLFLDDIAEVVESTHYPVDPPGRALPFMTGIGVSLRFTLLVVLVNLVVLVLLLLPGINLIAFLVANGYLLGREYFDLAALRYLPQEGVAELRAAKSGTVFVSGLVIAGFLAIPLLNLLTPLFATSFMVHLVKRMRDGRA